MMVTRLSAFCTIIQIFNMNIVTFFDDYSTKWVVGGDLIVQFMIILCPNNGFGG